MRLLACEIAGLNPEGNVVVCFFVSVACCHVKVAASNRSLVQKSPACDREVSIMRRPWHTKRCHAMLYALY